ncbi:hypothetical protein BLNAU_23374 [Blattamonas nauphoetae]|uniref:Uncharacterized protein n=1 Tax=Blattamonas nauphoetae TaxID=2049346 RepID=A0ABQ9WSK0_9EUKA|nr:hypothetical protein BLNAU_23374 [Blattamonas nauphoetae]
MIRVSSGCFGFLFRHRGMFGVVRLRVVRSAGNDVSSNTNPTRSRLQHLPNLRATTTLLYSAPTKQGARSLPIHSRPLHPLPSILAVAHNPTPSAPQQRSLIFPLLPQLWSCLMEAERGGMGERLYRRAVFPRLLCFCLFPPCSLFFSTQLRNRWERVDV